ncbi:E3 ubiquitin protein ligase UPL3 [Tanacetum coccineum]
MTLMLPVLRFLRPWLLTANSSDGTKFAKVIKYFRLLGCVMAKALQDDRLLDLPLSTAFYKLVLGQELDLMDVSSFDAELGKTCKLLDPDFTLKSGDEDVFDISALQIFSPDELDYLLCGHTELWEVKFLSFWLLVMVKYFKSIMGEHTSKVIIFMVTDKLVEHIKFDHGYTSKSPAVVDFVTGAPRLPPGGLAVLNPKLTIVRKHSSTASNVASSANGLSEPADDDLPRDCAISEGQGSFDLS